MSMSMSLITIYHSIQLDAISLTFLLNYLAVYLFLIAICSLAMQPNKYLCTFTCVLATSLRPSSQPPTLHDFSLSFLYMIFNVVRWMLDANSAHFIRFFAADWYFIWHRANHLIQFRAKDIGSFFNFYANCRRRRCRLPAWVPAVRRWRTKCLHLIKTTRCVSLVVSFCHCFFVTRSPFTGKMRLKCELKYDKCVQDIITSIRSNARQVVVRL